MNNETKRFGPYKVTEHDKRMASKSKGNDLSTPSTLGPYVNPYDNSKPSLLESAPGNLNTLVKRKLRSSISRILEAQHGKDFADNNWEGFYQYIIKAHLTTHAPKVYGQMLQQSQIDKLKIDFPDQLRFVSEVQAMIDADDSLEKIIAANDLF